MSISNKHNYKTFTKSPPASLLHCIESILNHSSVKCCDSLTMTTLMFTKFYWPLYNIFFTDISLATVISSKKDDTDTSPKFSSRTSFWYSKMLRLLDNKVKQLCFFQLHELFTLQ